MSPAAPPARSQSVLLYSLPVRAIAVFDTAFDTGWTPQRLLPFTTALFAIIAALIIAEAPAAWVSVPVAGLALVVAFTVVTGVREARVAQDALPVEGHWLDGVRGLRTFESVSNPHFRWYFVSMYSVFGAMNMQMLVKGVLVFQLTGSFAALGVLSLANAIPGLALSLPGGVIADRLPKKVVQQIGSILNALNTLAIAVLLLYGSLRWEYLLANAAIQGVIQGLMMPARQAMLSDIVYPRQIMNAVALNNAGMYVSRIMMPALGGIMLARTDAYWVFFLMAALYVLSAVTLIKVPSKPIEIPPEELSKITSSFGPRLRHSGLGGRRRPAAGIGDLVDGVRYMVRDRTVGVLLLINFLMVLFSMPYMQLLPGFVKTVLHGGAEMQGVLMGITGVGSVVAALVVASLPNRNRGRLLILGGLVLGVALTVFSFSSALWITVPAMIVLGVGQSMRMALSNGLVQAYADEAYRGRVMSIYMMEMNLVQFGTFAVALIAELIGIQWALGLTSIALVVLSVSTYLFVPRMRAIE